MFLPSADPGSTSRPVDLADGECQVWWGRITDARPGLLDVLDDAERARRREFLHPGSRDRYLVAHALTRLVLAPLARTAPEALHLRATCRTCGGPHGKPELVGSTPLELSLSHSGDWVAVAVARTVRIGVDIEMEALRGGRLPVTALSGSERDVLAALPESARVPAFIRYWTRKEALLKATGDGLTVAPARLTMSPPSHAAALVSWSDGPGDDFHLRDLDRRPGYAGCVASIGRRLTVSEHDGSDLLSAGR